MNEAFTGGFRTFPQNKKSARLGPHSVSELAAESSPSKWRAYGVPMVPEQDESEPVLEAESEEAQVVEIGGLPWEVVLCSVPVWYWRVRLSGLPSCSEASRAAAGFQVSSIPGVVHDGCQGVFS